MKQFLLVFLLFLGFSPVFAQNRVVEGTVTAVEDGSTMPGVNVLVEGTSKGTATDGDGKYRIELSPGENILNFSFLGYKTASVTVGEQTVINVKLESDAQTLDEVVVIGYGTVLKSDLTGSVAQMKGSDITRIPAQDPTMALQGKLAGVQVISSSGAPGSQPIVRIRGTGTFNDSSPIYVVDGVILQDIAFLSSSDIQSMEVLKDASSTAIYGSRGANGVVLITTKTGKKGPATFTLSSDVSIQQQQKFIDVLNGKEYATIVNEITPTYNNVDAVPNTDWQKILFKTAKINNHQVAASGSTDKGTYYFSVGYFGQEGIIDKSKYERLTVRLNNTYNVGQYVRIGNNVSLAPYWQQNTDGNAVFSVYRAAPVITPFTADGKYSEVPNVGNPLGAINYTNSYARGLRTVGNVYVEATIAKNFILKSSFGVDLNNYQDYSFTPVFFISPQQQVNPNTLTKGWHKKSSWLWENTATYNKTIGKHKINALGGFTMQDITSEDITILARNILRDSKDFWYITPGSIIPQSVDNNVNDDYFYTMISYLGRVNYSFDNRYLFTATFRRDGSSKFTLPANKYGNYPSVALGWNVINEEFMRSIPLFTNLKVRASYGVLGNDKTNYRSQYSRTGSSPVVLNNVLVPGFTYVGSGNPLLKWETTYQTDIGLELGFIDDRLKIEVDYYNRDTKDILVPLPVPGYFGVGAGGKVTYNAAEIRNSGFEVTVGWQGNIKEGWTYTVNANVTTIKNRVVTVNGVGGASDYLDGVDGGQTLTRSAPGRSIGEFYMYKTDGLYQNAAELAAVKPPGTASPGDIRFLDVNADGRITATDRVFSGSPLPTYLFGLNLGTAYKNFDLSVDINGLGGNKIYNFKETVRPDLYNFERHVLNRWTGENTSTTEPRSTQGGYNWGNNPSNRFIQKGDYVRLRSVSLGYTLPAEALKSIRLQTVKFYIRGTNLFTKTKYTGYTPEVGATDALLNGMDRGTYPLPAVYSVGLNATF